MTRIVWGYRRMQTLVRSDRAAEGPWIGRELCRNLAASRLVVVTGRRRVGKTELLLQTLREETEVPFVYLFCSRTTSRELIKLWLKAIEQVVELPFNPTFDRLSQVIEFLMFIGKTRPINIAIDECQDLNFIEPTFWSELQRIWDLNKKTSRTFLVMSGSVASAMRNIFQAYSDPLYGRVDRFVFVRPFPMDVVSEILSDYVPAPEPDELLALYTLTGGVVWFIEDLMDRRAFDLEAMSRVVFQPGSKFIMDGEVLLANEFRVDATVNRSILQAIAHGKTKREELQDRIRDVNISGFLSRLEKQYELIAQNKPAELPTNTLQNDGSLSRVLVQFRGRTSQSVGSEQLRGYASRLRQRLSDVLRACSGAVFLADVDERASLHGDRTVVG